MCGRVAASEDAGVGSEIRRRAQGLPRGAVTLIVPYMSQEFVALVSDRRITWEIGGATQQWEDTENKAIVLASQFLMGYTGFARLGEVKTERWVADSLAGV